MKQDGDIKSMDIKILLQTAVDEKASDLHLVAGLKPILRIDGELNALEEKEISPKILEQMVLSILNEKQKEVLLR